MDILWKVLATLTLVALNGFFVAAEFAAVSARMSRLETLADKNFLARLALDVKRRLDLYLSSCQLGITLASLALGAVIEPAVAGILTPLLHGIGVGTQNIHIVSFAIGMAISTSLHIVIGEQAPKNWAIRYADTVLPAIALPLAIFTYIFYPAIWALNWATNAVLRLTGMPVSDHVHGGLPHTEEELKSLLAQAVESGTIAKGHERLLTSAFEFGDLKTRQIMTPRTQVAFLKVGQPLGEMLRIIQKSEYTRFPVVDGDIDHVVGMIHMKDLFVHLKLVPGKLRFGDETTADGEVIAIADGKPGSMVHVIGSGEINLKAIRRDVMFVPELLPVSKLLRQFQNTHIHMGIVVDEYGATQGIVTLEDVLEEIVGEIADEFDPQAKSDFVKDGENFRVTGIYPLRELRDRLSLDEIQAEEVDTVGGYIIKELGRFPRPGDTLQVDGYVLRVMSVNQKRVGQVLISPTTQDVARADGPGEA
ncbi:MAG TPA: hemolysin family protein [Tepidisphaeraceae bacterium]|nr:hemolysin family protein [Tepidisphaeraceae bacterium]